MEVWAPWARSVAVLLHDGRRVALRPQVAPTPGAGDTGAGGAGDTGAGGVGGYHVGELVDLPEGTRYRLSLDGGPPLADPASRWQPGGVHGPSALFDPARAWDDVGFCGPPLERSVLYELHVGALTGPGTFDAAAGALDHLAELGVTTVEIMPVAQFPGTRNWGYDGVFPFAVQDSYGGPRALQRLVAACHRRGMAVALDVVYNHLGPEGNVLPQFGPYVTDRYATPWGPAMNLDGWGSDEVRRYLVTNALMWFADFHVDALRLDAVHGIVDPTARPFLLELAEATDALADRLGRRLLLIAETPDNDPRLVRDRAAGGIGIHGQWNDDFHDALRAVLTGERRGRARDFGSLGQLATALSEGWVFQGQFCRARGRRHGAAPDGVRPAQLVVYDQNHDQVGNRPGAGRLAGAVPPAALHLAAAVVLLGPGTPLLFMGEEYGSTVPFPYVVDHGDAELVQAVRRGRAAELGELLGSEPLDPADPATFAAANLHAERWGDQPNELRERFRQLLRLRREHPALAPGAATTATADGAVLTMVRHAPAAEAHGARLVLLANAGDRPVTAGPPPTASPPGSGSRWRLLASHPGDGHGSGTPRAGAVVLAPWGFAVLDAVAGEDQPSVTAGAGTAERAPASGGAA